MSATESKYRKPIVQLPDGNLQCMVCENIFPNEGADLVEKAGQETRAKLVADMPTTPDRIVFSTERPNHTLGDSGEAMISVLAGRKYTGLLRLSPAEAGAFIAMVDGWPKVVEALKQILDMARNIDATGMKYIRDTAEAAIAKAGEQP